MIKRSPVSGPIEAITAGVLLLLIITLRLSQLDADPPLDLSISTDVYTDPAQYTLFAQNYIDTGEFNPHADYRRTSFINSAITPLALVVFALGGVSTWSSNFVGVLFGLGALLFFYLFLRRTADPVAGIMFLTLIAFDYNLLFYGRLPFLEHAMAFFGLLALLLITHSEKGIMALPAGVALGIAVFFGKMIGLVFVVPFGCFFLYEIWSRGKRPLTMRALVRPCVFAAGFIGVAMVWYLFTYLPHEYQVSGYLGEQVFLLYGLPEGLRSFDDFVKQMVTMGSDNRLFPRLRVVGLLSVVFLAMFLYHATSRSSWQSRKKCFPAGHVFLAVTMLCFFGALMIWNYRPLRYQLIMIYACYGAAAIVLHKLWYGRPESEKGEFPWLFGLLCIPLFLIPIYQIWEGLSDRYGWEFYFEDQKYRILVAAALLSLATSIYLAFGPWGRSTFLRPPVRIFVIGVLIGPAIIGLRHYLDSRDRFTFTARDNGRDLGAVVTEGAVVSGPFAPSFALENELPAVIHMFGVAEADPELFTRFPITHVLLDSPNEMRARADYPEIMDSAVVVVTYYVGTRKVHLFRIAGFTGNEKADAYRLSQFERAMLLYSGGYADSARIAIEQFIAAHPDNMSGYRLLAVMTPSAEEWERALSGWRRAVDFSPTNYQLLAGLAGCYRFQAEKLHDFDLREKALSYYRKALHFAPKSSAVNEDYRELLKDTIWHE